MIILLSKCSIVNFILVLFFICRFYSMSCNLLMSPHGYFQNMKLSFKYLFHDLVKSSFMSLPYFLPIISYRFSSKYTRVAYVSAILVPSVWIKLMLLNWKELLLRIISIPSMINFLLNLGCNVSGYLSKMRWLVFLIHGGYYCIGLWCQMWQWVCWDQFFLVWSFKKIYVVLNITYFI